MATISLRGMCGYVWVDIPVLTLSPLTLLCNDTWFQHHTHHPLSTRKSSDQILGPYKFGSQSGDITTTATQNHPKLAIFVS